MSYGRYLNPETEMPAAVRQEWEAWLNSPAGNDPGNYDAYKDKEPGSPTNGQYKCDVYCPLHILAKILNP